MCLLNKIFGVFVVRVSELLLLVGILCRNLRTCSSQDCSAKYLVSMCFVHFVWCFVFAIAIADLFSSYKIFAVVF